MTARRIFPGWATSGGVILAAAIIVAVVAPDWLAMSNRAAEAAYRGPDWALWDQLAPAIKIHLVAAIAALAIGATILMRPKGRGLHKALGWSWVAAMGATAVSSLFITSLNGGVYSLVHLLSGWTIVALPMAILAIRNRKVEAHRRAMTGMFVGGLLVAGALAFLPGRFMFEFLFG
jgi:uncharacterized membrane protein